MPAIRNNLTCRGFLLFEVIVVIGICTIIAAFAVVSVHQMLAAEQMVQIETARMSSISTLRNSLKTDLHWASEDSLVIDKLEPNGGLSFASRMVFKTESRMDNSDVTKVEFVEYRFDQETITKRYFDIFPDKDEVARKNKAQAIELYRLYHEYDTQLLLAEEGESILIRLIPRDPLKSRMETRFSISIGKLKRDFDSLNPELDTEGESK